MKKLFAIFALMAASLSGFGQAPLSQEEREKMLYEAIDKEIERYSGMLELEDWQIFMIDSTLSHDLRAMTDELSALSTAKVSNASAYQATQDKWTEAIYQSYMRILNPAQQKKYLKAGAEKAKKNRDKRAAANKESK